MNHSSSTEMSLLRNDTPDDITVAMESNFKNLQDLHTLFKKQDEIDRKLDDLNQKGKCLEEEIIALVIISDAFYDIVNCLVLFFSLKKKKKDGIDKKLHDLNKKNECLEEEIVALVIIFEAFNIFVKCFVLFFRLKKKGAGLEAKITHYEYRRRLRSFH